MGALGELTVPQLEALLKKLRGEYREYQRKGLRLDMSRGKPNTEQLNLCQGMLDTVTSSCPKAASTAATTVFWTACRR